MVGAAINILTAFAFFVAFAVLRIQPINDRVYFPRWYLRGLRSSPMRTGPLVGKFVNLNFKSYFKFLNWMPDALLMPESELIEHAGLDSAIYLRIYLLGLKIFIPIAFLAFVVMVPVNWTNDTLEHWANGKSEHSNLTYSNIDKLSISNVPTGFPSFALTTAKWKLNPSLIQGFIEKVILDCRFFTFLAIAGSLLGSILCFGYT